MYIVYVYNVCIIDIEHKYICGIIYNCLNVFFFSTKYFCIVKYLPSIMCLNIIKKTIFFYFHSKIHKYMYAGWMEITNV